jgi:hypothetical protein
VLVQVDEPHHVAQRGVRLHVRRQQDHPRQERAVTGRRQLPAGHQLL